MKKAPLVLLSFSFVLLQPGKGIVVRADSKFYDGGVAKPYVMFLNLIIDNNVHDFRNTHLINLKLPPQLKNLPLAWSATFFFGMPEKKRGVYFLIANYDDTANCQIVFDKNRNEDFTDDSILNIIPGKPFITTFYNPEDERAIISSEFIFRNDIKDSNEVEVHKIVTAKEKSPLPARFAIYEKKLNSRKVVLADKNIVTLLDYDYNGFFNGKYDKIMAGDVLLNNRLDHNPMKSKYVRRGVDLPYSNNTYKVIEVDRYGKSITALPLNKIIDTADRLPAFKFTDEEDNKKDFVINSPKTFSVLYIWGAWCIGCYYQAPEFVHTMKEYESIADYYTLNYGDKEEKMLEYISGKKMPFKAWKINRKANDLLKIDAYPSLLVIEKKERIVFRTNSVDELKQFFMENKSSF